MSKSRSLRRKLSPVSEVIPAVLRALPPQAPGATARQVHQRMGCWALSTVRHVLREMAQVGLISQTPGGFLPGGATVAYRYWRAP